MKIFKPLLVLTIIFSVLILPFACKKKTDDPDPEPEPEGIIIADITNVMDEQTRAAIIGIDTVNYTFSFSGETDLLNKLTVGDIIVDSASQYAEYGYLRMITKIEGAKGEKQIETRPAGLTEAIHQGSIDFNSGLLKTSQIAHMELAEGVTLKTLKGSDFTVFDMNYDMEFGSGNDKITVDGNTSLSIDMFFKFNWSWCLLCTDPGVQIDLFESGVELNQSASINITSQYGASLNQRLPIATFYFEPWTFFVGPVPVVFVPKIELFVEVDGSVTAEFSTGASEAFNGKLGSKYTADNGWSMIKEKTFTYDYYPPELNLSIKVEANVGPEVSLLLYGLAGPYTNITSCALLDAELHTGTENWDLDFIVGVKAEAGVKIDVLLFEDSWGESICLFEQSLMHLENEPMENGIFWEYPIDGHWYSLGSELDLQARTSGATPNEVQFIVDGNVIATDTEEPFEYTWNTSGASHGEHNLVVNYILGGDVVSQDDITISLLDAEWEIVDLTSLGQNNETINYDVYFSDTDNGWMVGGSGYGFGGYLLHTSDAGATWQQDSPEDFLITMKEILFINESEILIRTFTGSIFTAGDWDKEFGYYDIEGNWIVTFSGYDVLSFAMSSNGYVTAVGRYYDDSRLYLLKANTSTHELVSETKIEKYYDDNPANSEVYFRNTKGFVYNIKDQSNSLKQYISISENGGASWETIILNASGITRADRVYDAFFVDEQKGWLVGSESQGYAFVLITEDGGLTWDKVDVEEAHSFGSVHFMSDQEGYATSNTMSYGDDPTYKLYHTMDGGYTWEPVELVYTKLPMCKVVFQGPYIGYAVGQGAETYRFSVEK